MDINRIVEGLMRSGVGGGLAGGLAGGLLVQALGSKKGRKVAGKAVKLGGAALVGGLAWNAYQQYRQREAADARPALATIDGRAARPADADNGRPPARDWRGLREEQFQPSGTDPWREFQRDMLVLRAMIAAANADGHLDRRERLRIYDHLEGMDLDREERSLVVEELLTPLSPRQLVAQVPNQALGAEVYLAALITVDETQEDAREFLAHLAAQLELPTNLLRLLHEEAREAALAAAGDGAHPNDLSRAASA